MFHAGIFHLLDTLMAENKSEHPKPAPPCTLCGRPYESAPPIQGGQNLQIHVHPNQQGINQNAIPKFVREQGY